MGQKNTDVLPSDGKQGLHSCYVSAINRPPHLRSKVSQVGQTVHIRCNLPTFPSAFEIKLAGLGKP